MKCVSLLVQYSTLSLCYCIISTLASRQFVTIEWQLPPSAEQKVDSLAQTVWPMLQSLFGERLAASGSG